MDTPHTAQEFLEWVAGLDPAAATTLAEVVHRARTVRGDGAAEEPASRLFAPTEINPVYTGPGAGRHSAGAAPAAPPPAGPPPPNPYAPPGPAAGAYPTPPPYRPAPAYPPPAYPPRGYPPPAYRPPAPPAPAPPPVPSPYWNPGGAPGTGLLPAWDALSAPQRTQHFIALPGWAQSLLWAQMNHPQRQELAALLPPRPGP